MWICWLFHTAGDVMLIPAKILKKQNKDDLTN